MLNKTDRTLEFAVPAEWQWKAIRGSDVTRPGHPETVATLSEEKQRRVNAEEAATS